METKQLEAPVKTSYTIGEAAERAGVSTHTLRYYDKEGLLPFVDRAGSGSRLFKEIDFEWLAVINCLKQTGMAVKDIKIFIDWCMEGDCTLEQRYRMFVEQKKKVQAQIDVFNKHMEKINYKIWYYQNALAKKTEDKKSAKRCLAGAKKR